ncbi:LysR family transcriptional regulator [Roseiarcus fermentans]|nr:LysR family transcriptional regulator [Roseiarcus fermentans]
MTRNLDTALIRSFVTVAETSSMTAAANALHLTQGAVSQQIKRLEDAFACPLFERDRRGLALTNAGERLLGKARRLLALNDEIWAEITTPAFTGEVRLGMPCDLLTTYLPPILKTYAQEYPQVDVALVCLTSPLLAQALAAGEIDLAIIEEPAGPSEGECLAIERLVWVGGKGGEAYLKRPLPLSIVSDTCAFRPVVFDAMRRAGLAWRLVFGTGSSEAITATVLTDLAVTASLAATVPPGLDILTTESGLPDLSTFAINLHLPHAQMSPIAQGLARHIRDSFVGRGRLKAA